MYREEMLNQLNLGFQTAFIDSRTDSNLAYKPEFLSNNYLNGDKLLSTLEEELLSCDEFAISVAFITQTGIEGDFGPHNYCTCYTVSIIK